MSNSYIKGFLPYAFAAFLVGLVGGFSTMLGPAFVQDLGLAYNNTTWTALATAISTATFAPILGKLGDVLGRKPTLFLGLILFTLGNILTALAGNLPFMLAARFLLGIGTAAIAPTVMSYILTEFPSDTSGKGFSLYMLISSCGVIFGPTLGSYMISAFGWRMMIWVCVVISFLILVACSLFPEQRTSTIKGFSSFDTFGAVFILVFFGLLLCIPSFGQNFGWTSSSFLLALTGSVISLIALLLAEKKAEHPILEESFLRRKAFFLSILALFLTQGLMQANMTNTIVFLNYTQPENHLISGYAISIMYLGMSLGSVVLGPLADRFQPKNVLTGSLFLTGIGCGAMLFYSAKTTILLLAFSLGILGFGLGGNGTIFMKVVLDGIPRESTGSGTGTYGLFRDLAAPFGVAVLVPLFTNRITAQAANGTNEMIAAVSSIRTLAVVELFCVFAGILIVRFLPTIHKKGI